MPVRAVDDKPSDTLVVGLRRRVLDGEFDSPPSPPITNSGCGGSCRETSEGRHASQSSRPSRPSRDTFACTREDVAAVGDEARRRPTAHEHLMTDLPDSAADRAANAPTPDGETPAGDPELAALVGRDASPDDATTVEAPVPGEPNDAALADTSPTTSEAGVEPVPVLPLAAAVTDGEPPGTASAPTVARPPLRRLVRPGPPARRRHRRRRPVRVGPAVRRPGPARRPRRQHGTRRAHPRAGGGGDRDRLWVAR